MKIKNIIFGIIWIFVAVYFFNYMRAEDSIFFPIAMVASVIMAAVYFWLAFKLKR